MLKTKPKTPLLAILRKLENDERRDEFAALAGTSTLYLYQLAGCHNKSCRSTLANGIADAALVMARKYGSLPITMEDLACMCQLPDRE
mgnify:CR=1 FL=1